MMPLFDLSSTVLHLLDAHCKWSVWTNLQSNYSTKLLPSLRHILCMVWWSLVTRWRASHMGMCLTLLTLYHAVHDYSLLLMGDWIPPSQVCIKTVLVFNPILHFRAFSSGWGRRGQHRRPLYSCRFWLTIRWRRVCSKSRSVCAVASRSGPLSCWTRYCRSFWLTSFGWFFCYDGFARDWWFLRYCRLAGNWGEVGPA